MLRNYITTALRNLVRNRLYAAINIVGLATGFTAVLFIVLFVRDEFSYDKWLRGYKQLYEVGAGPLNIIPNGYAPFEVADWLRLDVPEIEAVTRVLSTQTTVRLGDASYYEHIAWVDLNFFDLFRLPVVAGDLLSALARPDGIVLTKSLALKYFRRSDPIGETFLLDGVHPVQVSAVVEDLPKNSQLASIDAFASVQAGFAPEAAHDSQPVRVFGQKLFSSQTYFRLRRDADIGKVRQEMPELLDRHSIPPPDSTRTKASEVWALTITPINEIHLTTGTPSTRHRDLSNVLTFSGIGLLIVLAASINFINLTTARAMRRAVEVGVRKTAGASRRDLVAQFIGEALIYVVISMVFGLVLAELLLPSMNTFLGRTISFDLFSDVRSIAFIIGLALTVGLLAGAYPAFILSVFRPATVLKAGRADGGHGSHARQVLVVAQFAILIGLLVSTTVFYRQMQFGMRESLRQNTDPILILRASCTDALKDSLAGVRGVRSMACAWPLPMLGVDLQTTASFRDRSVEVRYASVDFGFFELYGLKAVAGRFFSKDRGTDSSPSENVWRTTEAVVINETAARDFGFESSQAAIGQTINWSHIYREPATFTDVHPAEIVGVVEDFPNGSIQEEIHPAIFYVAPWQHDLLSLKLDGQKLPETLGAIKSAWKQIGDGRPLRAFFFDQAVQGRYIEISRQAYLFSAFAGVAMLIAVLGLIGLSAFAAERRTREIGIRKAMGASKSDVIRLLLWQFTKPVLMANVIAWPAAYLFMRRWLEGFADHIELEPWIFLAASALALVIAVLAVSGHALLVARAKPVAALRYE